MYNIYVIRCNSDYKIGITNDINKRLSTLQTGNPSKLVLACTLDVPTKAEALSIEKALHTSLAQYNSRLEWFNCHLSVIVKELKNFPFTINFHVPLGYYMLANGTDIPSIFKSKYATDDEELGW